MRIFPLVVAACSVTPLSLCFGQESSEVVKAARILDTQEVDLGERTITYHRVETPILKPEPVKLAVAPVEEVPMTTEEEAELRKWEAKFQYYPFFGVTVYDGKYSEIRWKDEEQENVVWSNVNFLHFAPFGDLETETAYYWIMLSGWETTTAEVKAMNAEARTREELTPLPPATLPPLAKAGPQWQATGPLSGNAKRAMNDFHAYYRTHGTQMAVGYAKREAEAKAHEEWMKAHPPIPEDTVITYFPIRSSKLTATEKARLSKADQ